VTVGLRIATPDGVLEYADAGTRTTLFRGPATTDIRTMHSHGIVDAATAETRGRVPVVLVADDDEDILTLVALRFRRSGMNVILARDGEEALELAQAHAPDAAVLDVSMPKLTGLEVTRRLRELDETRSIPIVLLTARVGDSDVELGLTAGADEYVTKPFSPQDLYACVETVLRAA
jgi:CheY-like chemotaxis protein